MADTKGGLIFFCIDYRIYQVMGTVILKLEISDEVEELFEEISPYIVGYGKLADEAPDDIKEK